MFAAPVLGSIAGLAPARTAWMADEAGTEREGFEGGVRKGRLQQLAEPARGGGANDVA